MCRSAVGWALLSELPDNDIAQLVKRHNAHAEDKILRTGDVMRHVRAAREKGYALSLGGFLPGVGMLALPVSSRDGLRRYALGVGGPIDRVREKESEIAAGLRACRERFLTPGA